MCLTGKGECGTNDDRNGYGYRQGRIVRNSKDSGTAIDCITGDRFMCQYISDSYLDSGADADFCAQNRRNVSVPDGIG